MLNSFTINKDGFETIFDQVYLKTNLKEAITDIEKCLYQFLSDKLQFIIETSYQFKEYLRNYKEYVYKFH